MSLLDVFLLLQIQVLSSVVIAILFVRLPVLTENLALITDNLIINDYIDLKTNYNRLKDVCILIFISIFFGKSGKELMRQCRTTNTHVKTRAWAVPAVWVLVYTGFTRFCGIVLKVLRMSMEKYHMGIVRSPAWSRLILGLDL